MKVVRHIVIFAYVIMTTAAFAYTLFRIPLIPKNLFWLSYTMMAPFQQEDSYNIAAHVKGVTPSGSVVSIDYGSHLPFRQSTIDKRVLFLSSRRKTVDIQRMHIQSFLQQLQRRERAHGNEYERMQLFIEKWPRSPEGSDALRKKPFIIEDTFAPFPVLL